MFDFRAQSCLKNEKNPKNRQVLPAGKKFAALLSAMQSVGVVYDTVVKGRQAYVQIDARNFVSFRNKHLGNCLADTLCCACDQYHHEAK